jgi:hypothetical protein
MKISFIDPPSPYDYKAYLSLNGFYWSKKLFDIAL